MDAVPRAGSAAESEDSAAATRDTAARNDQIEALKGVVEDQRDQLEKQGEYIEDLRNQQERFSEQVGRRIEETETRVGSRISRTESSFNSKLLGPSASDFGYESSKENMVRLNKIRELTLKACSELEDNFGQDLNSCPAPRHCRMFSRRLRIKRRPSR